MEARRDVFQAIADPTRRAILSMIAQKPLNLNAISENFDVTRQAISLHIRILSECGLVAIQKQGRERFCEARLDKLSEVTAWIEKYRKFWSAKLEALGEFVHESETKGKIKRKRTKK